jgi:hypothetical protein
VRTGPVRPRPCRTAWLSVPANKRLFISL